jgi:hypothetical protein
MKWRSQKEKEFIIITVDIPIQAREASKTWNEVKKLTNKKEDGGVSRMPYAPEGPTGTKKKKKKFQYVS